MASKWKNVLANQNRNGFESTNTNRKIVLEKMRYIHVAEPSLSKNKYAITIYHGLVKKRNSHMYVND